jgi:hypothetical protein
VDFESVAVRARSLGALDKARAFGMTQVCDARLNEHATLDPMRHPEWSRFSGETRDLAWGLLGLLLLFVRESVAVRARSLGALVKARAFGMTQVCRSEHFQRLRFFPWPSGDSPRVHQE